ncbi:MAG TPA: amidohydrolase family protein [Gemmatimonadaceae bacterium]|nr:amidohydrolase family protein [Gemmatimonadaceae bacterium]
MTERPQRAWCTSYRAAWVIPVAAPPIRGGAVVVEGSRIAWVGRAGDEPPGLKARTVELGAALLAPGFVNAHTHLDLTVLAGLLDGRPFFEWIRGVVACREALTADELLDSARLGILEGLAGGVTTFGDTAPGDASFDAMRELGVRGIAYQEVFGPDPATAPAALDAIGARIAALRSRASSLVRVGISPHAPYSVSDALYAGAAQLARDLSLPLATHVAESAAESELVAAAAGPFAEFLRGRGIAVAPRAPSPVALLERTGVLAPGALLIHCVRCGEADIAAIARAGAAVVTCPMSNRYFGHGVAPVAAMRRSGIAVGVGSDSMASNGRMDIPAEADAALAGDPAADAADRWALATREGARALGLADLTGTLEAGKAADLVAFPLGAPTDSPPAPPASATARLVVVDGVERVRDGRASGDVAGIAPRVRAAAARLRKWRDAPPRR